MKMYKMQTVCEMYDLDQDTLYRWMEAQLIQPSQPDDLLFDEEDIGRIQLIIELKQVYNSNDETLEIILHLVDQIHLLRSEIRKNQKDS